MLSILSTSEDIDADDIGFALTACLAPVTTTTTTTTVTTTVTTSVTAEVRVNDVSTTLNILNSAISMTDTIIS